MPVPSEIRKLLGNREPSAHASLSCSFQGPIGETHFVVADGQLFVFDRESMIGEFRKVELDPAHPPKLMPGTFNDELHVALADGGSAELQVSSFDRDSVRKVLEAIKDTQFTEQSAEALAKAEAQATDAVPDDKLEDAETPTKPADDAALIDLKKIQVDNIETTPPHARHEKQELPKSKSGYTTPLNVDPDETKEAAEAVKAGEKRANKNIYYGSDPGCAGCLIQTVLFFGGILAMWFAHEQAALNLGVVEPDQQYDESAIFVITKILAVVAGMYLGGKSAALLGKVFQKFNWTGFVAFVKDRVLIFGQRGKWQLTIDASSRYELQGGVHTAVELTHDNKGKSIRVTYSVFLRLAQNGQDCILKTSVPRTGVPAEFAGLPLKLLDEPWKDERMITMDKTAFRQVLKRLQDWQ